MKTLVTGATGFVGSVLVHQLLDLGVDVRILRRETSSLEALGVRSSDVEHFTGDLRDADAVNKSMKGITSVYHVGAFVKIPARKEKLIRTLMEVNVTGTANVVDAALGNHIEKLIHTSSIAAYGRSGAQSESRDETSAWVDSPLNSHYAISKYKSEQEIHRGVRDGLDAVIVNPAVVFGPGRVGANDTLEIFNRITTSKWWPAKGGGITVVDVRDVAKGHILAMEKGQTGERYTLGGEYQRWDDICSIFCKAAGVSDRKLKLPKPFVLAGASLMEVLAYIGGNNPRVDRSVIETFYRELLTPSDKAINELGYSYRSFVETATHMAVHIS